MGQLPEPVYRFGPFRYDPAQRLLFRDGETIPLPPKTIELLEALLRRRGEAVSKEELIKAVWPDCVVEEIGLARNVSILRKALGDNAEQYVETIPKRGYRFVAGAQLRGRRSWWCAAVVLSASAAIVYWQFYRPSRYLPRVPDAATLAVISFEPRGPDARLRSIAEALDEALVAEIANVARAEVISPSTVQRYRRLRIPVAVMARVLGLDVVVEGSVQGSERRVAVVVRLSDVRSGRLIWAETYDGVAADVAELHKSVARPAAERIAERLGRR